MHRSYRILLGLVALLLALAPSSHCGAEPGSYQIVWYDDMEGDVSGWSHYDQSTWLQASFHPDTYLAFDDPLYETDYSWWVGLLDPSLSGGDGYGNGWYQWLRLPPVDLTQTVVQNMSWGAIKTLYRESATPESQGKSRDERPTAYPVLTFAYRYDSEPDYDCTYLQAQSEGDYVNLNNGYSGSSGGWHDLGLYGYLVGEYDNPLVARFLFTSDSGWSDEDGLYDSDGGAFHVDNIKVFDFIGGGVYFYDDVQDGGLCTPGGLGLPGDHWHVVERACPAFSDPRCWWCGDDADTSLVPPNLMDMLCSPAIDVGYADGACTLYMAVHAEVPTDDNDYWTHSVRFDEGMWYQIGAWWGDFGQCDGWGAAGLNGHSLDSYPGFSTFQMATTFYTTDDGCGPGTAGGAGVFLDDVWLCATITSRDDDRVQCPNPAAEERLRAFRALRHTSSSIPESPYAKF
jgi:hypothetical protein